MVGTTAGVTVFLLLLLAAVQIVYDLHATSTLTAVAHDAAREVASVDHAPDRCAAVSAAEGRMRLRLGEYAERAGVTLDWTCRDPDAVRLRVRATHPSILPPRLAGLVPLGSVDRTVKVRLEELR